MIKIYNKKNFLKIYKKFKINEISKKIKKNVKKIFKKVKLGNKSELLGLINKYDNLKLKKKIYVKTKNVNFEKISKKKRNIFKKCIKQIFFFHKLQKKRLNIKTWFINKKGNEKIGQIVKPIEKILVYVPGGLISYSSSLMMNVIPAIVAGVKKIYVTTPAKGGGFLDILFVSKLLGIDRVYRMGGSHSIFSFSLENNIVPNVNKIVGPGNVFVNISKKMVYGDVGINSLSGPTELLIILSKISNVRRIIFDILSQLEHDCNAKVFVISNKLINIKKIKKILNNKRIKNDILKKSIKNIFIIYVKKIIEGIKISNYIAPEHIEFFANKKYIKYINNAGSIFFGKKTCEVLGDYSVGVNHTLPTNSNSKFSSSLGIYDFLKYINFVNIKKNIIRFGKLSKGMSKIEKLFYHYKSIRCRL